MKKKKDLQKSTNRKAVKYRGVKCLNCEHPLDLSDKYCAYCSQINSTKKVTFKDFFEEFFSSIISYDSRFRKTLSALIFRPGKITEEYVAGKRMKYANPFRFYLSVSIIFFIIWGTINNFEDVNFENPTDLKELENSGINLNIDGIPIEDQAVLDSIILSNAKKQLKKDSLKTKNKKNDKTYADLYISEKNLDTLPTFKSLKNRINIYSKFNDETSIKNPSKALDSMHHDNTAYHRWLYKKTVDGNNISSNAGSMIAYFTKQVPFIIFFFLPVFALGIWLLYTRRKYTYTDHLIFLFHVQTMFFVLLGFGLLLDEIVNDSYPSAIAFFIFMFYLYKAMRRFYKQGRFKTIVKYFILHTIFSILAIIGSVIAFAFTFATY